MPRVGIIRIDSEDDERLAEFRNVPDPELLTRLGLFVAEGRLVVARLLASGLNTRAVLVTETALASLRESLTGHAIPVYVVPQTMMNAVAGFNFHRGCLAIGVRPPARDWREMAVTANRLVVLERVGNADNVGSIFRNAAAFGVDGVLLQADCADPLYRKAIRTSMAASLTVPYATVRWPDALRELARDGWDTVAMTPAGHAPRLRDVAATLSSRVAIVLGHEGEGLTDEATAACTHRARIAMATGVDSINVSTAAAVALYEICNGVGGHLKVT
jgi:tRNA G18 (ribose-2'-O)-methylase SpoU